jgi:hypothetical protein
MPFPAGILISVECIALLYALRVAPNVAFARYLAAANKYFIKLKHIFKK